MSKMKKWIYTLLITIISMLGFCTISKAYQVGQEIGVSYWQYEASSNIFCLEHGQNLVDTVYYKIVSHVRIDGTKSTDHTGKTIDSWYNAKMAGILASNASKEEKKNAVWNFGYTWMGKVGARHAGLYAGFASNTTGSPVPLDQESTDYANSIKNQNLQITDKTDKSKIRIATFTEGNTNYLQVGPFKWDYEGDLSKLSVYDQDGKAIGNLKIGSYRGKELQWGGIEKITSNKGFYIAFPSNRGVSKITKISASVTSEVKSVDMWFLDAKNAANQNLMIVEPSTSKKNVDTDLPYDILLQGNLKVIKVDENNQETKLEGVGFYIQYKDNGKYVKQNADKTISYVDDRTQATEFVTDKNGEILIENLLVGTYTAYETKNPNYGYEIITAGVSHDVTADKTEEFKITNKRVLIKLSGYVWEDIVDGKQAYRNDLYQNGTGDTQDKLVAGITVRLKDKSGKIIQETKTDSQGAYLFTDVLIEHLSDYYVEFEYDGLTYQPVTPHLDKDNGSKADESDAERKAFNDKFAEIQGTGETTGVALDASGNKTYDLNYVKDTSAYTSTFIKEPEKYLMIATTANAGYDLSKQYTGKEEEIKNINLGIYEREKPDLAVMKDVENAKVTVNGYEHTYLYAQRFQNQGEYEDGFNVGVKFGNKYGTMTYTRAIYKSDVEYKPQDASKELKVYITYHIRIGNQSTNLSGRANSIVDYFDARYNITKVGNGIDDKGNITGELQYSQPENYNNDYKKVTIYSTQTIEAQKVQDIYIQFELNRDAVLAVMNDQETLDNVVEMNSYTSFDRDGNIYAGIDLDSNPGNAIPGDKTTYEDDTDSAPSMKLELTNARELTGKVFLDETSPDLLTAQVREGDGEYKEGEKGISGVKLTLKNTSGEVAQIYDETTKQWVEAKDIETDENGDFAIRGYVPDEYVLTYTWGDDTYTIQNYKGTIYKEKERANNPEWYKTETPRYSDAMDDWELRNAIDKQTASGVAEGETLITKMDSTTPMMRFGIEFESTITDNSIEYELDENGNVKKDENGYVIRKDSFLYRVSNVDFGIVERPRQELALEKRVKTVKITLGNGNVLIDATINEEGKLEGQVDSVTGGPQLGFVKAEIDSEILQQSQIEIGYEIVATNISECDYVSENGDYYFYGQEQAGDNIGELVKLRIGELRDYLDETLVFIDNQDGVWQMDTEDTTVEGRNAFVTQALSEKSLAPTEQASVEIKGSRQLANADEIEFNNLAVVTKLSTIYTFEVPEFYGPELNPPEDPAEPVTVTPPTGENQNYVLPISIGLSTLVILGAGVWLIKKKVLNK